jgi:hypothetical protein
VDPLGLEGCPGGDGCKKPAVGEQDPAAKVGVDEEETSPPVIRNVDPTLLNRTHAISGKTSRKVVETLSNNMRKSAYDDRFPIEVAEHNGDLYILDGHHRAAAARQTGTKVTLMLIKDIAGHKTTSNSIDDVIDSARNVGFDRLEQRRR